MGTTLLGIDLDESPVGGLIENLLSEEDLKKLTDGGRDPDEHADASDGDSDEPSADDTDEDSGVTDVDTGDGSAADTEAAESGTDIVDDAVGSEDDADSTTVPVGTSDETADAPWDTGGPSAAATGLNETTPAPEATTADEFESESESESDDEEDWTAKLRPLLLKATLALVVLAVITLVLYRYMGTIKDVAGDKLPTDRFGGDDDDADAAPPSDDDEVSPARRRAKATGRDETDDSTDADRRGVALHADDYSSRPVDEAVHSAEDTSDERTATGDRADTSRPETDDSDVGALVGLAALALVAAVVRKFGEDRPRDPLVDGPADEHGDE